MRKIGLLFRILLPLLFCLLAAGCFSFPGYRFSGLICLCIVAVLLLYYILAWLKKRKPKTAKVLFWILTILLIVGMVVATVTLCIIARAAKGGDTTGCDYVIVLGAGVNGTQPSLILSERINRTFTYLQENPQVIAVLSGGQGPGESITEAQCMFDRLTAMGIRPEQLLLEERSTSTWENIRFSLEVIRQVTGETPAKCAVISNEFHLYRAGLLAQANGLEAIGVPARTTWLSLRINYFLREIAGVWHYILLGG